MTIAERLRYEDEAFLSVLAEFRGDMEVIVGFVRQNRRAKALTAANLLRKNILCLEDAISRQITQLDENSNFVTIDHDVLVRDICLYGCWLQSLPDAASVVPNGALQQLGAACQEFSSVVNSLLNAN